MFDPLENKIKAHVLDDIKLVHENKDLYEYKVEFNGYKYTRTKEDIEGSIDDIARLMANALMGKIRRDYG